MTARALALLFLLAVAAACPRGGEAPATGPGEEVPPPESAGWLQPILAFEEPPPTGHTGMYAIARDRVGPLYGEMPAEIRFLRRLFTDYEVRRAVERNEREREEEVFEIYDQDTRLLVVEPDEASEGDDAGEPGEREDDEPEIDRVRVESPLFRSPAGLGVGDSFEVIARAHGPLECRQGERPGNGEVVAICRGPGDAVRWVFPAPDEPMPPGWLSVEASAEALAGSAVVEVWWRPSDERPAAQ